ncbi:MAG: glycosyltransferase family 4 protein [Candidatus Hodarchaeota archaeon]
MMNKPNIVIAHCSTDLKRPHKIGGAIRRSLDLLNYFKKNDFYVLFIGVYSKDKYVEEGKNYKFISISKKVKSYRFIPLLYLFKLFLEIPKMNISSNAIIITFRMDVIIPFTILCPSNHKILVSDEPLGETRLRLNPFLFKFLEIIHYIISFYLLRMVDYIVTDPSTTKKYIKKYPWLIYNIVSIQTTIVDINVFKPMDQINMRQKYGFTLNEKIIIFIGRLVKIKNVDFLLRAYNNIKNKNFKDVSLIIVGKGEEERSLKKAAQNLKLSNVKFLGAIPHNKIPEILNCADVLALCSESEGSPIVVREALACGVPVVSTDVGDVSYLITNDVVGRIVERDEEKFASALIDILQINRDIRIIECIKIAKKCTAEYNLIKYLHLCKKLNAYNK